MSDKNRFSVLWRYRIDVEDPPATDSVEEGSTKFEDMLEVIAQMCNMKDDDWVGRPDEPVLDGIELPLDPQTVHQIIAEALGKKDIREFGTVKISSKRIEIGETVSTCIEPGDVPDRPAPPTPDPTYEPEDPLKSAAKALLFQLARSSHVKPLSVRMAMAKLKGVLDPAKQQVNGFLYCTDATCGDISCHHCYPFPGCHIHATCSKPKEG